MLTGPISGGKVRLYYSGAVDSIGDVNGELSYNYDRRGRLLATTSYTGSVIRADTMYYDTYERDSVTTGPTGKWVVRYDGQRGLLARVVTPYADSTTYSFDGQGRMGLAYAQSTGPTQYRTSSFTATSGVARLEHMVDGTWYPGVYDPEGTPDEPSQGTKALGPTWIEQHGLGAPVDSTVDSLTYDGWERLLSWRESRKAPPDTLWRVKSDSVSFDADGNVLTSGGAETYEAKTGHLLSRTDPVTGSWTYSYDAAGNQTQAAVTLAGDTRTWAFSYDALNRLVTVRYSKTTGFAFALTARYGYDVLGRRIVKRVYSILSGGKPAYTRMSYVRDAVSFDTDSLASTILMRYTWGTGIDNLIGVRDSAGIDYQVVQDQLHSVRGLVRRDGTWVLNQRFVPSGRLLTRDTSTTAALPVPALRYGWTGREYDAETGLYFNRARYYDPGQRRFTQEDPIGYGGSANLYAYVDGGVVDGRDPSGLEAMFIPAGGGPDASEVEVPHGGSIPMPGGTRISSINQSDYIAGDSYLDDLMSVTVAAQNGRAVCSGDVCGVRGVQVIEWGQRDALPNDAATYSGKNSNVFGHMSVLVNNELFDFDSPEMLHSSRREVVSAFLSNYQDVRSGKGYNLKLTDEQISSVRESLMGDAGTWDPVLNNCTVPIQRALRSIGYNLGPVETPWEVVHQLYALNLVASVTNYPHH